MCERESVPIDTHLIIPIHQIWGENSLDNPFIDTGHCRHAILQSLRTLLNIVPDMTIELSHFPNPSTTMLYRSTLFLTMQQSLAIIMR